MTWGFAQGALEARTATMFFLASSILRILRRTFLFYIVDQLKKVKVYVLGRFAGVNYERNFIFW